MERTDGTGKLVADLILEARNNGGATIGVQKDGTQVRPSSGYVVGGRGPSLVIHPGQISPSVTIACDWVGRLRDRSAPVQHFGSWKDERGNIWLDAVDVIPVDEDAARAIGKRRGEIAIFDLTRMEEITL